MYKRHKGLFDQFTETFQPDTIASWQELIDKWKKDRSQLNPFLESGPCK
jgi:hypothetical protein